LILPLELGREFHEREYLTFGSIQSAKLVVKRRKKPASGAKALIHFAAFMARLKSCPDTKLTQIRVFSAAGKAAPFKTCKVRRIPPFAKNAKDGAPRFFW